MRKIVVYELSLDGVGEAPDTFFGWDDAVDTQLPAVIATQDAVILGRRTYTEWVQFWPSSQIARDLKQQPGGDIGVHGRISVAQALLAADVVDELRLVIGAMIAGRGRRLFDGLPPMQLESIRSEISATGYLLVDYRIVR